MDRNTYIDEVVENFIPKATTDEKLAVMAEIWSLFDMLILRFEAEERFDSMSCDMVESESYQLTHDASIL
jgi:hypothetical protein